jgi:glycine cleavage system T protein (aminomethyltransferase)
VFKDPKSYLGVKISLNLIKFLTLPATQTVENIHTFPAFAIADYINLQTNFRNSDMKTTSLSAIHESLGAKMVPFAGYNMPVSYEGVNVEHKTVRNGVGVFDVSHMGEFLITGPKALELIQRVTSNDAAKLVDGQAQYSCFPNSEGGIVDDLILYRLNVEKWLLVVNASNIEKDWNWINSHNTMGAEMRNISDDFSLLAIQGPKAIEAMQSLTSEELSSIKFYTFKVCDFAGIDHVIISATGYTGSGGFEIYCKNNEVEQIWNKVMAAGSDWGIKPVGLAARDTLRLEMGYCLYGNDIDDATSPLEAGLGWITKFTKDFINADNLRKQKEQGPERRLIAFELNERGVPRQGYDIVDGNGKVIGKVTSGTMSPSLGIGIGMGYVPWIYKDVGTQIHIQIRKKAVLATVVKLPFYKG